MTFTLDKLAHAMRGMPRDARIMIQLPDGTLVELRWSGRCIPARTATMRPSRPRPAGVTPSFWSRKAGARRADRPGQRIQCGVANMRRPSMLQRCSLSPVWLDFCRVLEPALAQGVGAA